VALAALEQFTECGTRSTRHTTARVHCPEHALELILGLILGRK
jgi:hypothetical protein